MSGEADTIRRYLDGQAQYESYGSKRLIVSARDALAALDVLVAENERYRDALERIYQQGRGPHVGIARDALNDAGGGDA
ncbi:MAG: hypothetical protein KGL39_25005 [Patescibacteria group bacterium]|nr:hypothetical protein [Patescibacteria group bacterium]